MLIPRSVVFDKRTEKAICSGVASNLYNGDLYRHAVINLPSTHYDFIDFDVRDKTEAEIRNEITP